MRQHDHSDGCRLVGVPWSSRDIITDSTGKIRKRYITRALVQTHERQTVVQPAKVMHKFMCQGVVNVLRTSSIERNIGVNQVLWCNKKSLVVRLKRSYQVISRWNKNRSNMRQSQNPVQYHHSHPAVQEPQKTRVTREQSAHAWR